MPDKTDMDDAVATINLFRWEECCDRTCTRWATRSMRRPARESDRVLNDEENQPVFPRHDVIAQDPEATHASLLVDGVRAPHKLEGVSLVDQYGNGKWLPDLHGLVTAPMKS